MSPFKDTRALLAGASYVGMVEGTFYSNLDILGPYHPRGIAWHSHMILWGVTERWLAEQRAAANARYAPIVPGRTAFHFRPLQLEEVFGQAIYMSKGQINDYRGWPDLMTVVDRQTGELSEVPNGRYTVKKRPLRPGDAVRLCGVFADRFIDGYAFAAGDGGEVLRAVNHEALADFRRCEAKQACWRRSA